MHKLSMFPNPASVFRVILLNDVILCANFTSTSIHWRCTHSETRHNRRYYFLQNPHLIILYSMIIRKIHQRNSRAINVHSLDNIPLLKHHRIGQVLKGRSDLALNTIENANFTFDCVMPDFTVISLMKGNRRHLFSSFCNIRECLCEMGNWKMVVVNTLNAVHSSSLDTF